MKKLGKETALFVCLLLFFSSTSFAKCKGSFIDPLTEVCWQCTFPIKIGGVTAKSYGQEDAGEKTTSPVCACGAPPIPGLTISFWEPIYIFDTVCEPGCFPAMGFDIPVPGKETQRGSENQYTDVDSATQFTFMHAHFIKFPVWVGLGLLKEFAGCWSNSNDFLDIGYMTEVDPMWRDDQLSLLLHPEALLFASPPAQLACVADSSAANVKMPLKNLFWCTGSWGSSYPMTGNVEESDPLVAGSNLASRLLYKMHRELLIPDTATDECGPVRRPIWNKEHWKLQMVRWKNSGECFPIGRTDLIWGINKTKPLKDLNLSWIVWRKHVCCVKTPAIP